MKKNVVMMLSFLLAVVLVFTACSNNGGNKPSTSPTVKETEKNVEKDTEVKEEVIKLTAYMSSFGDDPRETELYKLWKEKMEAHVGKKLDIEWIYIHNDDYVQKLKLKLASGEAADIMSGPGTEDAEMVYQFGNQGALLDIAPYIDEYAPNFKKFLEGTKYADKTLKTPEGKMFFFGDGFVNDTGLVGSAYGSMYRFDIFKKHDIKVPETWDEFYDAAKKLKELYPDVYPVNAQGWPKFPSTFFYTNHTNGDIYWNGEKYVYGPSEEAFKEGITFIRRLYEEKLLDPEFLTQSQDQLTQKTTTGKTFMIPFAWLGWDKQYSVADQGVVWGGAILPKNEKYGEPWMQGAALTGKFLYPNYGTMISEKTKHPEIMVQLLDYQYSDEMIELMHFGVEGKTFEVKDGKKVLINPDGEFKVQAEFGNGAPYTRQGFVYAPQNYSSDIAHYAKMPFFGDGQYLEITPQEGTGKFHAGEEAIPPWDVAPIIRLSKEDEAQKAQIMTAVKTFVDESITKFILGNKDIKEWDQFQAEILKVGDYQSIVDKMNEQVNK